MSILVKGGVVVNSHTRRQLDVRLDGEKIVELGADLAVKDSEVVDASGCFILPGFIDAHTHLELNNGYADTSDNFTTGSAAAVANGTTTVIDMATPDRGKSLADCLATWNALAENKASCDYNYHMSIIEWTPAIAKEIPEMAKAGVTSFKMYLAYDNLRTTDAELYEAMKAIKSVDGMLGVHCENGEIINQLQKDYLAAGKTGPENHPLTRPNALEAEAVNRYLTIANTVGLAVNIVHLSTKESLAVVKRARAHGQKVYVETCPQYLTLTDDLYRLPDFEGAKYVCSPPLRSQADQEALWQGVMDGDVDTISTDHCDFDFAAKEKFGKADFTKIPGGLPGVETRPAIVYTTGVATGKISLERFVALLSENIAKQFALYPQKGVIQLNSDADIVVWDPKAQAVISQQTQLQHCDYSAYEGFQTTGKAKFVFLRGKKVAEDGKVIAPRTGRFVFRKVNQEA